MINKNILTLIFLLVGLVIYGRNGDSNRAKGSWSGKMDLPNGPTITLVMHFKDVFGSTDGWYGTNSAIKYASHPQAKITSDNLVGYILGVMNWEEK